jgi:hypothetical protein
MIKSRNLLILLIISLFLFSTLSASTAVSTVRIGQTSYGYVEKIGPYGNGPKSIGILIGVHPQEGTVRKAMFDAINSHLGTFKNKIYIFRVILTKGAVDREKSRIYGETLANKFIVPNIDKKFSLVIDVHGNRGLYQKKDISFIFAPSKGKLSVNIGKKIADKISWLDYFTVTGTSPPKVTIPIAKKGVPSLVLEFYRNENVALLNVRCIDLINTVDQLI